MSFPVTVSPACGSVLNPNKEPAVFCGQGLTLQAADELLGKWVDSLLPTRVTKTAFAKLRDGVA
jgi:hypothetical protein